MMEENLIPNKIIYRMIVMPDSKDGKLFLSKFVEMYVTTNSFLNFRIDIQNGLIYICYEIEEDIITNKTLPSLNSMFETKDLLIYSVGFDDLRLKRVEILARGNAILQEKYIQKTTERPYILEYAWQTELTDKFIKLYQEQV
jgi:hypothetical protein